MKLKKWIPLLFILVAMLGIYFSGLYKYLSFDLLKEKKELISSFAKAHPLLTPLLFILLYVVTVALSLPVGAILSIFGGFLFPFPLGLLYVLFGASTGAVIVFLAAKTAFADILEKKAGPFLQKMEKGFKKSASSYLLFLRFAVVFPFWLVNLAPAFFGVSLWTFTWTTFVGIIPGSFVYTQAGRGLEEIFATGKDFSFNSLFNTHMKIALACLALFSLTSAILKKRNKKRHD